MVWPKGVRSCLGKRPMSWTRRVSLRCGRFAGWSRLGSCAGNSGSAARPDTSGRSDFSSRGWTVCMISRAGRRRLRMNVGGHGVPRGGAEAGASELGCPEVAGGAVAFSGGSGGSLGEFVQAGAGEGRPGAEAAPPSSPSPSASGTNPGTSSNSAWIGSTCRSSGSPGWPRSIRAR